MKKQIRSFSKNQSPNLEPKWYPKPADNEVEPNRLFHFVVPQIWEPKKDPFFGTDICFLEPFFRFRSFWNGLLAASRTT